MPERMVDQVHEVVIDRKTPSAASGVPCSLRLFDDDYFWDVVLPPHVRQVVSKPMTRQPTSVLARAGALVEPFDRMGRLKKHVVDDSDVTTLPINGCNMGAEHACYASDTACSLYADDELFGTVSTADEEAARVYDDTHFGVPPPRELTVRKTGAVGGKCTARVRMHAPEACASDVALGPGEVEGSLPSRSMALVTLKAGAFDGLADCPG